MAQVKKPQPSTRKAGKPTAARSYKSKSKDKVKRPPPRQVKTKRATTSPSAVKTKPKKPQYTDAQLNLPAVNSIIPASAATKSGKGTGKKRKVYVDDTESMMTILAMVNAEKEGQIESKVLKARQLEEIREARKKEAEKRAVSKKEKFEGVKMDLKRGKGKKDGEVVEVNGKKGGLDKEEGKRKKRKSVSFA